jgi:hypothetical protein
MAILVKFMNGEEKEYAADAAGVAGPLFVLSVYDRKRRKLESAQTFPAEGVVWARFPDGRIVIGKGTLEPTA